MLPARPRQVRSAGAIFLAARPNGVPFLPLINPYRPPALVESFAMDSRVAQTPIVHKGFASARKIGGGFYATISDTSKVFKRCAMAGSCSAKTPHC